MKDLEAIATFCHAQCNIAGLACYAGLGFPIVGLVLKNRELLLSVDLLM